VKDVFNYPVLQDMAFYMESLNIQIDQAAVEGHVPLTPVQQEFFAYGHRDPHHYNLAVMLLVSDGFPEAALEEICLTLQNHHDALRIAYKEDKGKAVQYNHDTNYPVYAQVVRLGDQSDVQQDIAAKTAQMQESLDLENGPLMKVVLFKHGSGDRLFIVIHHLVMDAISWKILIEDLDELVSQFKANESLQLPEKTHSYQYWARKLQAYAHEAEVLEQQGFWKKYVESVSPFIKKSRHEGPDLLHDSNDLTYALQKPTTQLLISKANVPFNTNSEELLLAALVLATQDAFEAKHMAVMMESHGRDHPIEGVHLERTIGWFTCEYPVVFDTSRELELHQLIKHVKETLRKIPNGGIGYGLLQYTDPVYALEASKTKRPQVLFNYVGDMGSFLEQVSFEQAAEPVGFLRSQKGDREYDFEIICAIIDQKLTATLNYNPHYFETDTIVKWWEGYASALERVVNYCAERHNQELTPSDLGYKDLSVEELDEIKDLFD
ncbi:MAG: condensation domain-containing protein, partial [Pseudomonadota bacterium]